jgi:hypothetical protein
MDIADRAKFAGWIEGRGAGAWRSLLASFEGTAIVLLVGEGAEGRFLDALSGELTAAEWSKIFTRGFLGGVVVNIAEVREQHCLGGVARKVGQENPCRVGKGNLHSRKYLDKVEQADSLR